MKLNISQQKLEMETVREKCKEIELHNAEVLLTKPHLGVAPSVGKVNEQLRVLRQEGVIR